MIADEVFKANDIRGIVTGPDAQWDAAGAERLGAAFVAAFGLAGDEFVLGRDMRHGGAELSAAFAAGARRLGSDVVDLGLCSTDQVWFASGVTGLAGVQFTASHNPGRYNGIKFCRPAAAPITTELMDRIRELSAVDLASAEVPGQLRELDLLAEYASRLHSLVDLSGLGRRRLRVVVDAGNGMAGHTTPAVLGSLPLEVIGLYLDLDGDFPNHPANPLEPANLVDAQLAVVTSGADLALVFDGDADRCFIIDERGEVVSPAAVTSLIAEAELARDPGSTIVVNTITSAAVGEVVRRCGGALVVGRVGHTHIKAEMADHHAVFGGEHSAHYYFRDFWGADTGMLAALHVLALLAGTDGTLSSLVAALPSYAHSGELNHTVDDPEAVIQAVAAAFMGVGEVSRPDGLMVTGKGWWVSVRSSNTEPLLRLNVEAAEAATMESMRDRALAVITAEAVKKEHHG